MKKRVHVNQHIIRRNQKTGERKPVLTVKTYKSNDYCHEAIIEDLAKLFILQTNPFHVALGFG